MAVTHTSSNAVSVIVLRIRMYRARPDDRCRILACSVRALAGTRGRPQKRPAPDRYRGLSPPSKLVRMGSLIIPFVPFVIIQAALIIHCIRTGRNRLWIVAIALLIPLGALAYVIVELLPELFGSRGTRSAVRGMRRALDPGGDLRRYEAEVNRIGDVASRQRYAEELIRHGRAAEAVTVYRQALTGLYESDPNLLLGLAQAQFANSAFAEARATLEDLIARNPQFKSPDGHLLYARALEAEGNTARALEEYAAVTRYYAGAEAAVRYAQLLTASGNTEQARRILKELLETARVAPRYYRRMQRQWLVMAEHELSALP